MPARETGGGSALDPLTAAELGTALAALGPFERSPVVAVACSGGADSLALTLLADHWVRQAGGHLVALTVDHGLRPDSAAEARQVGAWLRARGIAHRTLRWTGAKPVGNRQAAARSARLALLAGWCRCHRVLHVLLAHHRDDQAETLLLRLGRGSGLTGLAAMAPLREALGIRFVRPLLAVPRARLRATLSGLGQPWISDPSNDMAVYARTRARALLPQLGTIGASPGRVAATAARLGRARHALELATATLLARCVSIFPSGYAWLDAGALLQAEPELRLRGLAYLLTCIGAAEFPPREERLGRLVAALASGFASARTLHGCRIVPHNTAVLVFREAAAIAPPLGLAPGSQALWDGRFALRLAPGWQRDPVAVGALGARGGRTLGKAARGAAARVPRAVWPTLPALWCNGVLVAVPHLGWEAESLGRTMMTMTFRPRRALLWAPVAVAAAV